jgi:deoxyribose-phosphate aldolase
MRRTVPVSIGVKASGGIRSLDTLRQMLHAGANRIGTSSGVSILQELAGTQPAAAQSASAAVPLSAAKIPGGDPQAY